MFKYELVGVRFPRIFIMTKEVLEIYELTAFLGELKFLRAFLSLNIKLRINYKALSYLSGRYSKLF